MVTNELTPSEVRAIKTRLNVLIVNSCKTCRHSSVIENQVGDNETMCNMLFRHSFNVSNNQVCDAFIK